MYKLNEDKLKACIGFEPHENQLKILDNMKRFTCITAGRRFGKTLVASYLAMKYLCLPRKTVWVVAPTYDLAKKTWRYIYGWVLREFPNMKINQSTLTIECPETESILELKTAENPASCIGSGVDFLIIDEASRIKETVWQEALYPTLSDKKGRAFMISTPKGKNWFYELYLKGLENQYEEYQSFSFETRDNLALPHLVDEQEKAKKNLPENIYQQEYEAKFLEDAGQVFRNISACVWGDFEDQSPEKSYVLGVDLAKYEDYTVIFVLDLTTFHVVYYDRFNKIDWAFQRKKIKQVSTKYYKAPIVIDSTGVGDPIAEQLDREGYVVEQYKYTNASKKFLIENLALKVQQREVTFPSIPELVHELEVFGYEYSPSGNITYNAPQGFHDDCVNALALAVYGAGHYKRDAKRMRQPYPAGSFGYITEQIDRKAEEKDLEFLV